jgi:cytochrome c-type biogenesis protein CcmE
MTELSWEKPDQSQIRLKSRTKTTQRIQFLIGGVLLLTAVIYLIMISTASGAQYFITIDELLSNPEYVGQPVRLTGAVVGDTIEYDANNLIIDFTIAHIPSETDNLALALHQAVNNPDAARLSVHIEGEVKPDLLENEAQAILSGELGSDGVFYANELLLKCPSRYEDAAPDQAM